MNNEVIINPALLAVMSSDDNGKYITVIKASKEEIKVAIDDTGELVKTIKRETHSKLSVHHYAIGSKWYISAEGSIINIIAPPIAAITPTKSSTRNSSVGSLPIRNNSNLKR